MLFYCKTGNFGDDLNPWLWSRLAPELCAPTEPTLFLGIGTILSATVPARPRKVVFGSGWSGRRAPVLDRSWTVYCVRGPLTAAGLHLDAALAITDPALLIRRVPLPPVTKRYPVSLMPHHRSMHQADWAALTERVGIRCIDPRAGVDQGLTEIRQTQVLLTEAMHGAIVADALRVPWIPVRLYSHFADFKWRDWTASLRLPLSLADVPPVFTGSPDWRHQVVHALKKRAAQCGLGKEKWNRLPVRASTDPEVSASLRALEQLPRAREPLLSDGRILEAVEARLVERLAALREAWPERPADSPKAPLATTA